MTKTNPGLLVKQSKAQKPRHKVEWICCVTEHPHHSSQDWPLPRASALAARVYGVPFDPG
uniref:Uncharacterized protein n=1 Tax=Anguilla anguilla TaxID=7936 RepID=A0A0E9UAG4_ANGAN